MLEMSLTESSLWFPTLIRLTLTRSLQNLSLDDLGLDSLDTVEVVMAIEDEFAIEIPDTESDKILSVEDAIKYIASHPMAK